MEKIREFLGAGVARWFEKIGTADFSRITEIRLRVDKPIILRIDGRDFFIDAAAAQPLFADNMHSKPHARLEASYDYGFKPASPFADDVHSKSHVRLEAGYDCGFTPASPTSEDIRETMERISQYSFYAYEAELSMGYITLPGGHRVGVSGQTVIEDNAVRAWRYISGINIRVARSVLGCADSVLPHVLRDGGFLHTMIISPPAYGKTTLLRDIVRQISNGFKGFDRGLTVGLADERSEIAGCFRGVAQNDVGIRTDVIDGCPKALAMVMLLRAMSPDVIAVDELGGEQDARAVDAVLNAGVKLLCTAHGRDVPDVMANPSLSAVLSRKIFERFIVLDKPSHVLGVYDSTGKSIWLRDDSKGSTTCYRRKAAVPPSHGGGEIVS
ncbi:MAG: stage III sporulation protein AA [Defluviitaleaceae bacterium]|nr:stage III sporulation protein AA [Defluviitaleaceae bacterium]